MKPDTLFVTLQFVIKNFKHKGLEKLFERGSISGIQPKHETRLRRILALLTTSSTVKDMDLSGLNLHELKGRKEGRKRERERERYLASTSKWKLACNF